METGGKNVNSESKPEAVPEPEELQQQKSLLQHNEAQAVLGIDLRPDATLKTDAVGGSTNVDPLDSAKSRSKAPATPFESVNGSPARSAIAGNGAIENQYFFEDEIYRFDKKGRIKFGLVIETSGQYSGDEDDDFDDTVLQKGEVRVAWYPEGKEEALGEKTVALADRTLMPGDVVRRLVPGKDTQRGYCREICMYADVKVLGTKYVIKNVMTERLRAINQWQRDSAVCLDSWVGSTKDVEEKAVLRASSGARIEISSNDFYAFTDFHTNQTRGIYNPHVFYPGNVVIGRLPSLETAKLLTPNIPIHKNRKGKPFKGKYTVESIVTDSVWVHWQCKALSEDKNIQTNLLEQPNPCVAGENLKRLKRLNLFESCMLQISDRSFLTYSKLDTIIKKSQWDKEQAAKFKLLLLAHHKRDQNAYTVGVHNGSVGKSSEKPPIKLDQLDSDKTNKSKKSPIKTDKLSKTTKKEKQEPENNEASGGQNVTINNVVGNPTHKNSSKNSLDAGWVTDDEYDEENDYYEDGFDDDVISTTTTCSSPSPHNSPKHMKRRFLHKKASSKMKKSLAASEFAPKDGDVLVTETLLVSSTATVVWQDGSIETGIPSTQLYPIHHLDNHEFFPGDLVISGKDGAEVSYRDYGVIQTVDHHGRTAHVKWFTTYTSADEPKPTYRGESEVSVYDLKDHPDFQYRPGTMVIRVANFVGEDANCTAGQIIDNYIDGRTKVWWVDGHISMCWPQDLFEVGQYDHWGHDSDESWETESENSELGNVSPKLSMEESDIISNIDRARMAISRLQEIFTINPVLQSREIMRRLLALFKRCRYLDRLLNTSFFHEDNFEGLIARVRKGRTQSIPDYSEDKKHRLFSYLQSITPNSKPQSQQSLQNQCPHQPSSCHLQAILGVNSGQKVHSPIDTATNISSSKEYAPKILINITSAPIKCSTCCNLLNTTAVGGGGVSDSINSSNSQAAAVTAITTSTTSTSSKVVDATLTALTADLNLISSIKNCSVAAKSTTDSINTQSDQVPIDAENVAPIAIPSGVGLSKKQTRTINTLLALSRKAATDINSDDSIKTDSAEVTHTIFNQKTDDVSTHNVTASPSVPTEPTLCSEISAQKQNSYVAEKNQLLNSAIFNIEKAFEKTSQLKSIIASLQDDSKNASRNENCDGTSTGYSSSLDLLNTDTNGSFTKCNEDQKSVSCSSIELNEEAPEKACVRLCCLMKDQLVKCINEIYKRYYKEYNLNLSEVFDFDPVDGDMSETVIDVQRLQNVASEEASTQTLANNPKAASTPEKEATKDSAPLLKSTTCLVSPTSPVIASDPVSPGFQVLPASPKSHKYHFSIFYPYNAHQYYSAVQREHRMLKNSLPPGVWVRVFEDRMDLLSVMIEGPKKTPYEDGLFFFDIQLGQEYPKTPPQCHYISYCKDRLNPNLYEDGKVCVSLLGTWTGRDTEMWGPKSTLLQVIVSIQGLILVPEPYFNEAGYDKQRGTQQGSENSRMYNEMAIIKMVQATTKLLQKPPILFRDEIVEYYKQRGMSMYERIKGWVELSKQMLNSATEEAKQAEVTEGQNEHEISATSNTSPHVTNYAPPEFLLVPASRGFCLTLEELLDNFKSKLETLHSNSVATVTDADTTNKE